MIYKLNTKEIERLINIDIAEMSKLLDANGFRSIQLNNLEFVGIASHSCEFVFDINFDDDFDCISNAEATIHVNIQDNWKLSFYV